MRQLVLLSIAFLVVVAAAVGAYFGLGDGEAAALVAAGPEVASGSGGEAAEPISAGDALDRPMDAAGSARLEAAVAADEPAADGATSEDACVVLGAVLDAAGAPLPGVTVRLSAYRVWAEGVDVPRLKGRYDLRGFETSTDEDGAFRIAAPVPTAERTSLRVLPDRFHDSHVVRFGTGQKGDRPRLGAGVTDLGELRLAGTGAVRGRVTDTSGRPLADVEMDVGPGRSTTYSRGAWTEADGGYLIAHAPVGTYGVKAKLDGYLAQFLEPVEVLEGRDTTGVDFVLAPAPTIEGLVVDEHGRPLAGARVGGWPVSSGAGAWTDSGADGRFVLHLPQDEPYALGAKLDGHRSWGDQRRPDETFAPGTTGLRIVLETLPRTRFTVVDDESGRPLEHFGLEILENNGSQSPRRVSTELRPPPIGEHPGGVAERTARPGIDLYVVAAEGYLLATGDVAHEAPDAPVQTVRMRRGATVLGRVVRDGAPVEGALVVIERGSTRKVADAQGEELEHFRAYENTSRSTRTDAAGRFEVRALESGTHRVVVRPSEGAPLVRAPLRIRGSSTTDLGDLELVAGATLIGTVLAPPGVDPVGLKVYLDDWQEDVTAVTDADGRVRFEQLAPGVHTLTLGERPGVLASGATAAADLAAGEEREVTLDAREMAVCAVALRLELGDLSPKGVQVDLVNEGDTHESERLGHCDEEGRVSGAARAWGPARVRIWLRGSGRVVHPTELLDLRPGGSIERTVRFDFARLVAELPAGVELPTSGEARVRLVPAGGAEGDPRHLRLRLAEGRVSAEAAQLHCAGEGRLSLGALLPGSWELTLELVDADAELVQVPVGRGVRVEQQAYYSATKEVVLVAGEELVVALD